MEAKHINQHSTCTSSFINGKYDCRHKLGKNTNLIKDYPATSYVTAMFHPTIGPRAP